MGEHLRFDGKLKGIPYSVVISKEIVEKGDIESALRAMSHEYTYLLDLFGDILTDEKMFKAAQEGKMICKVCYKECKTEEDLDTHPYCRSCFDEWWRNNKK